MRNRYDNSLNEQQPTSHGPYPKAQMRSPQTTQPYSGDGHGSPQDLWLNSVGLYMRANPGDGAMTEPRPIEAGRRNVHTPYPQAYSGDGQSSPSMKPPAATRADTWKLVMLCVLFLVWISTASALLFLYMDRYLFPG